MGRMESGGGRIAAFQVALRWGEGDDWSILDSWLGELQAQGDEILNIHFSADLSRAVIVFREGGDA